MRDGSILLYRFRIPEEIANAIEAQGQKKGAFIREAIHECLADPQAVAERPFYHFKESVHGESTFKYVSPEVTAGERKWFKKIADVLGITERDLVSNALIHKLGLEKEARHFSPPPIQTALMYDGQKLAHLERESPYALSRAGKGAANKGNRPKACFCRIGASMPVTLKPRQAHGCHSCQLCPCADGDRILK